MTGSHIDLDEIEVELDDTVLEAIDEKAFKDHRDNRDAAVRDLLDEWLKQQSDDG
jgi:metal-responsive CopG/Arc/MetJ family transcriptional regulator